VVVTGGGMGPSYLHRNVNLVVSCSGDLGSLRDKHEGRTNYTIVGWASAMLTAALIAYNDCLDFVFQEQDCLAFGPYIDQLYAEMGNGTMTIGGPLNPPHQKLTSSQSLFLVRHSFIPSFVSLYLSLGEDATLPGQYGEQKFTALKKGLGDRVRVSGPWNLDRNRPLPWEAPVWAAQQWTLDEYNEAKKRELIR